MVKVRLIDLIDKSNGLMTCLLDQMVFWTFILTLVNLKKVKWIFDFSIRPLGLILKWIFDFSF